MLQAAEMVGRISATQSDSQGLLIGTFQRGHKMHKELDLRVFRAGQFAHYAGYNEHMVN